jgi:hypothetical protein
MICAENEEGKLSLYTGCGDGKKRWPHDLFWGALWHRSIFIHVFDTVINQMLNALGG